jgi:HSP20 family protein
MTQKTLNKKIPVSREEFLTPFDSLFDNMIEKAFPAFGQEIGISFFGNNSYPKVDVSDHADKIQIEAEIPGLSKEDVNVDLEDNVLTIVGQKRNTDKKENVNYIRKELKRSNFQRSFKLNSSFNLSEIAAKFENGILLIDVPKKEAEKPKKIKIL